MKIAISRSQRFEIAIEARSNFESQVTTAAPARSQPKSAPNLEIATEVAMIQTLRFQITSSLAVWASRVRYFYTAGRSPRATTQIGQVMKPSEYTRPGMAHVSDNRESTVHTKGVVALRKNVFLPSKRLL